ncbi:phosphopantothenoylcysteine decarboxylase [Mucisphaera calidilacus]|uniref:phosphopantothenoylcysteine decarboxylase n=1 Tax=Mucisphaera calidilacus TaxID=2527982 RepID=UPI001F168960|nr:phosphopantothenoylcysteine decarboxylase [Mucisphaera calidilacus]
MLITVGPTREPIDRVRFIGNRSSGEMGSLIAEAMASAGHEVTSLVGPVDRAVVARCSGAGRVYRFESSAELGQLLEAHFRDADVLVMAAAVADYRPVTVSEGKMARLSGQDQRMVVELMPTPDLVAGVAGSKRAGQRVVAFALEEAGVLEARAGEKMRRKGVDAMVANPLGTMESGGIRATWMTVGGEVERLERMPKSEFASWLAERVVRLFG